MSKAVTCPVCIGRGQLSVDSFSTAVNEKTCHGCNGKGWVEVL